MSQCRFCPEFICKIQRHFNFFNALVNCVVLSIVSRYNAASPYCALKLLLNFTMKIKCISNLHESSKLLGNEMRQEVVFLS